MWYVIPEVTYCVFVFIGPVFLTVLLVSSRHGWYHRSDHACVTWINSSRDISFLLVQILARDHGSLGRSVWSIDATISPIFSSFSHPPALEIFKGSRSTVVTWMWSLSNVVTYSVYWGYWQASIDRWCLSNWSLPRGIIGLFYMSLIVATGIR